MVVNTSMGGSDSTSQCKECTLLVTFKNRIRTVVYTIIGITANESGSQVHMALKLVWRLLTMEIMPLAS